MTIGRISFYGEYYVVNADGFCITRMCRRSTGTTDGWHHHNRFKATAKKRPVKNQTH